MMKSSIIRSEGSLASSSKKAIVSAVVVAVIGSLLQLLARGEPLYHAFGNMLFFTPYYGSAPKFYQDPASVLPKHRGHVKIAEIQASEYTEELMAKVSNDFRDPVLVKGLFLDTVAVKNWIKSGYLSDKFGDLEALIYHKVHRENAGLSDNANTTVSSVGAAWDDILHNERSETRFIFPQLALLEAEGTDSAKAENTARELMGELDLGKIKPGFGGEDHKRLFGRQLFMGRGLEGKNAYQGLGWHTEPANNWFVQVAGKKRWFFVKPQDSTLMLPKKRTARLVVTSDIEKMEELDDRLPILYGDVGAGDMIYNPEWYWHKTQIYPGVSISVSLREFWLMRNFRSNPMYSAQSFLCILMEVKNATFLKRHAVNIINKLFYKGNQ